MSTSTVQRVAQKIAQINKKRKPVRKTIKRVTHTPKMEANAQRKKNELLAILNNNKLKSSKKLELVMKNLS
jgi:hypothetical protein